MVILLRLLVCLEGNPMSRDQVVVEPKPEPDLDSRPAWVLSNVAPGTRLRAVVGLG